MEANTCCHIQEFHKNAPYAFALTTPPPLAGLNFSRFLDNSNSRLAKTCFMQSIVKNFDHVIMDFLDYHPFFITQRPTYECVSENYFAYFSTETCVVGTQKNRLDETVLLGTQNTCLN